MCIANCNAEKNSRVLIYVQLPRTGGKSLIEIIKKQYGKEHVFSAQSGWPLGDNSDIDKIVETKSKFKAVEGHIPFGIHKFLNRPYTYITMLRDPVEEVVSMYHFLIQCPWASETMPYLKGMSFEDYLQSDKPHDNSQTRFLRGVDKAHAELVTRNDLGVAKKNLSKFDIVGLTDKFDETLIICKHILGWEKINYHRVKEIKVYVPSIRSALSPRIIHLIEEQNKLDIELYEYARHLFDQRVESMGDSFANEVCQFKKVQYGTSHRVKGFFEPAVLWVKHKISRIRDVVRTGSFKHI